MSHSSQMRFFEIVFATFPEHGRAGVLDIGSLDINGGPHSLIAPERYLGVDLAPGPNVDLVARGEALDLPNETFDLAISSECFEHNPHWRETLLNMIRMVRVGGLVVFSCATTGRPEHGTIRSDGGFSAPFVASMGADYYANVKARQIQRALRDQAQMSYFMILNKRAFDLYFVGMKGPVSNEDRKRLQYLQRSVAKELGNRLYGGSIGVHMSILIFGDGGARVLRQIKKRALRQTRQ